MVTKKRKNLEIKLRKLEPHKETIERLKYFYEHNREFYEKRYKDISYEIGCLIAELNKYNKEFAHKLSEQNNIQNILAKLEYSEDIDKYLDCLDEMVKPLEKVEFSEKLINKEMILGYFKKTLPFSKFMAIVRIINGNMEEK